MKKCFRQNILQFMGGPMGGPLWPCVYLAPLWR